MKRSRVLPSPGRSVCPAENIWPLETGFGFFPPLSAPERFGLCADGHCPYRPGREHRTARPAPASPLPAVTFPRAAGGTFLPRDHQGTARKARAAGGHHEVAKRGARGSWCPHRGGRGEKWGLESRRVGRDLGTVPREGARGQGQQRADGAGARDGEEEEEGARHPRASWGEGKEK